MVLSLHVFFFSHMLPLHVFVFAGAQDIANEWRSKGKIKHAAIKNVLREWREFGVPGTSAQVRGMLHILSSETGERMRVAIV